MSNLSSQQREEEILKHWSLSRAIVANLCLSRNIKDKSVVEDCQSAVAVDGLVKAVDSYDESRGASLKTWIIQRVKYSAIGYFRKFFGGRIKNEKNRELKKNLLFTFDIESADLKSLPQMSVNGTENKVCNKDLVYKVFKFIDGPKLRLNTRNDISEIFYLHFIEGYLMCEIAEMKKCTRSNISLVIKKTKIKIQEHFTDNNKGEE